MLRDMLREYRLSRAKRNSTEEEYGEAWVMKIVEEVRNEPPMSRKNSGDSTRSLRVRRGLTPNEWAFPPTCAALSG